MTSTAYIALGSNLGDRHRHLDEALQALDSHEGIVVEQVSSYYETDPVGGPSGQGDFLNAAAKLRSELTPEQLLAVLLQTEQRSGRVRSVKNAPRTLDLDVLLFDDRVLEGSELTLPHPRMHERTFVLQPLAEISPEVVHPVMGRSMRELLEELACEERLARATPHILGPWPRSTPAAQGSRRLDGLRSMVTGSTSGIGRAIAVELASDGADVVIHGGKNRVMAEQTAALCRAYGSRSEVRLVDLREPAACDRLVEEAWSIWGGLDAWINNAGADTLTGDAASWSFDRKLAELWSVDVQATIRMSRAVGARMQADAGGVILNMGWDQAETGMEGDSGQLFAATKSAIMSFSKSLALSLAPDVRVNCLAPGWIRTAWGDQASDPWQERVRRETPLERWGTPEDVARTTRWLVSCDAAFVTGQVVRVNGGAVR